MAKTATSSRAVGADAVEASKVVRGTCGPQTEASSSFRQAAASSSGSGLPPGWFNTAALPKEKTLGRFNVRRSSIKTSTVTVSTASAPPVPPPNPQITGRSRRTKKKQQKSGDASTNPKLLHPPATTPDRKPSTKDSFATVVIPASLPHGNITEARSSFRQLNKLKRKLEKHQKGSSVVLKGLWVAVATSLAKMGLVRLRAIKEGHRLATTLAHHLTIIEPQDTPWPDLISHGNKIAEIVSRSNDALLQLGGHQLLANKSAQSATSALLPEKLRQISTQHGIAFRTPDAAPKLDLHPDDWQALWQAVAALSHDAFLLWSRQKGERNEAWLGKMGVIYDETAALTRRIMYEEVEQKKGVGEYRMWYGRFVALVSQPLSSKL